MLLTCHGKLDKSVILSFDLLQHNIAETSNLIVTKLSFQTKTGNMDAKCYVCKSKNPRICFPSDNTMLRSMTAAAYQTQELVYGDECPEPPPNTSIPVLGHDVDISCPFFRTTEIYSWIGSVSFSEPQSMRSVSGYHSFSVSRSSEVEGAVADQGQTATTSPGLWVTRPQCRPHV